MAPCLCRLFVLVVAGAYWLGSWSSVAVTLAGGPQLLRRRDDKTPGCRPNRTGLVRSSILRDRCHILDHEDNDMMRPFTATPLLT